MITKTRFVVFAVAASLFGSSSTCGASPFTDNAGARIAGLPLPAPVGHRQPRAADVSGQTQSSPADQELRRIDEDIDRKLIICRGC